MRLLDTFKNVFWLQRKGNRCIDFTLQDITVPGKGFQDGLNWKAKVTDEA